jgi:hypothetical protein
VGRKTSVYLSDELAERVRASGVSPAELIRRGLDAGEPEPLEVMLRRVLASVLGDRDAPPEPECPHPKARIVKGLCNACGSYVGYPS